MRRKLSGTVVVLVLALMAGSAAQALPTRPVPAIPGPAGLLTPLWSWLAGLLTPESPATGATLRSAWAEAGGMMDPNGVVPTPPGDAGGEMDPDGLTATPPGDEGPAMDPNG